MEGEGSMRSEARNVRVQARMSERVTGMRGEGMVRSVEEEKVLIATRDEAGMREERGAGRERDMRQTTETETETSMWGQSCTREEDADLRGTVCMRKRAEERIKM